jgi:hypothetical protein
MPKHDPPEATFPVNDSNMHAWLNLFDIGKPATCIDKNTTLGAAIKQWLQQIPNITEDEMLFLVCEQLPSNIAEMLRFPIINEYYRIKAAMP